MRTLIILCARSCRRFFYLLHSNHRGMSLRDDLKEINGIGDATADKVLDAVNDHRPKNGGVSVREVRRVREMLDRGAVRPAQSRLDDLLEGDG